MIARGQRVQAQREALGRTVAQVANETRIPAEHISAIEAGDLGSLPTGPYAEAWVQTLEAHLGLAPAAAQGATEALVPSRSSSGLGAARAAGLVAVSVLLGAIAWQSWNAGVGATYTSVIPDVSGPMVRVEARRSTNIAIQADDGPVESREMPGGAVVELEAVGRVVLDVDAVDAVRVEFLGERVIPQGRQQGQRRRVFIDDAGGAR
jgi:hypothetical protein